MVGDKKYDTSTIVRAFEYFSVSRSLYNRLRHDYELPSISLLTRITSKLDSSLDDKEYLNSLFSNLDEMQKHCVILVDEVYVKPSLTYHAGSVFGKAVNNPDSVATTVLSFMMVSLYGGPKYLFRILPVNDLDANFVYQQTNYILDAVSNAGGIPVAIICDNNRVNQALFKKFDCVDPWLTESGIFLLFDFVHMLKSVRNNWITEKCQKLSFEENGTLKIACWSDLIDLHRFEEVHTVNMSKHTKVSTSPKPIERQKVSTYLSSSVL